MIELVKGYSGQSRAAGRVKVTVQYFYRCTLCGTIETHKKDLVNHLCKKKVK